MGNLNNCFAGNMLGLPQNNSIHDGSYLEAGSHLGSAYDQIKHVVQNDFQLDQLESYKEETIGSPDQAFYDKHYNLGQSQERQGGTMVSVTSGVDVKQSAEWPTPEKGQRTHTFA